MQLACRASSALLACALLAVPLAAQPTAFGEVIEVRVINVDAVVTGPNGVPVRGLGRDEFELLVNGKPVPIDYFAAVEDGLATLSEPLAAATAAPAHTAAAEHPYLVVLWDQRAFKPKDANEMLDRLIELLPNLAGSTRGIMVARQGTSLGIEQTFTTDLDLVRAAIERLDDRPVIPFSRGSRRLLLSRLESAPRPEDALTVEQADEVLSIAERLLSEINQQALEERQEAERALGQLRRLVNLLSNLPGRKSVLYFGSGVQTRPAEAVYRLWWTKYRSIAARLRVPSIGSQIDANEITSQFARLSDEANHHRVAFYIHDVGGSRPTASLVEHRSLEATTLSNSEWSNQQQNLLALATSTGGLGSLNVTSVDPLLASLTRDMLSYYSLGFEATAAIPEKGRLQVRVRHPELRVRHFTRFDESAAGGELERAAMTALFTEEGDNPLEASVEVGASERQKNGTHVVPIRVTVPISQLALLPQADRHVGKLSLVVLAQSADGDLSEPALGEVPIEIDNSKLLQAMGQLAGYRLRMRVSEGEQTIVISLRDDIARRISTLNLALDPGQEP